MATVKGIRIDPNARSPYDLPPRLVEAQEPDLGGLDLSGLGDMGEDDAAPPADAAGAEDAPAGGPSKEEMVEEVEKSAPATWEKYLQPILKDIKNTVKVPIELHNNYTVPIGEDPDLGFHITGVVHFLEEVPDQYVGLLHGEPLRYVAYVGPDGLLSKDVDLIYSTDEKPYKPIYRHNPNVYR